MLKASTKLSRAMDTEGALTDASKRQSDEHSEWSFRPVSSVSPSCGILSLEKWGKVIIRSEGWFCQDRCFGKGH